MPEPGAPGRAEHERAQVPAQDGPQQADGLAAGGAAVTWYRHRRGWIAMVVALVTAAAGAGASRVFSVPEPSASNSGYNTGTFTVTRGSLTAQTQENGTLGDAGSYTVVVPASSSGSGGSATASSPSPGSGASTFTSLPSAGQTIRQGQQAYQVNDSPVILLYGNVPAYRELSDGMTGADVTELNTDLVTVGYATAAVLGPRSGWDYFSAETAYALARLQAHLGVTVTGTLPLGQAVFLPGATHVVSLGSGAVPGAPATPGAVVLTGSSLTPVVTVDLDASLQTEVAVGNQVSITLPDGSVTGGVISRISISSSSSARTAITWSG